MCLSIIFIAHVRSLSFDSFCIFDGVKNFLTTSSLFTAKSHTIWILFLLATIHENKVEISMFLQGKPDEKIRISCWNKDSITNTCHMCLQRCDA